MQNFCVDMVQTLLYFFALSETLTMDTSIYSIVPWKSEYLDMTVWIVEALAFICVELGFSFHFVFPGCMAFHLEICINSLVEALKSPFTTNNSVKEAMQKYRILCLSTLSLRNFFKYILFAMCVYLGIQQFLQCYIFFQLIRMGAGFEYLFFLSTDMLVSKE